MVEGEKPTSILKVVYLIKVPVECPVYLKNNYGIASLKNLNSQVKINSRFSKIGLENIHGNMIIESVFGDLLGTDLWGNLSLNARRTDMFFQKLYGNVDINAEYGLIKLLLDDKLKSLTLNANNSEVFILGDNPFQMGMDIQVKNGQLDFPLHPKYKVKEQKESGLASPTSINMKNSFIIKNADESFDAYYHIMKKRKQGHQSATIDGMMSETLQGGSPQ